MHDLLKRGVYAFVNDRTKTVYVGQTTRSFLTRYVEHLSSDKNLRIDERKKLFFDIETKFLILKTLPYTSNRGFLSCEKFFMIKFKDMGYTLLTKIDNNIPAVEDPVILVESIKDEKSMLWGYRKTAAVIFKQLAISNSIPVEEVRRWFFNDVRKHKNLGYPKANLNLSNATLAQLEYICLRGLRLYKKHRLVEVNI